MKRTGTAATIRRRGGEHGQVLILAVVTLILVIIAILLLFDVQTVIRGKVKAQNGVDAAALTGAEWQKHSLNLIGELNLVRATGTLISDPFFARGVLENPNSNAAEFFADLPNPITQEEFTLFPEKAEFYRPDGSLDVEKLKEEVLRVEKEKRFLDALDGIVSQLQARLSFVGPLVGFGAAQQAAKNNGLTFNSRATEFYISYLMHLGNGNVYDLHTPIFVKDYGWRTPYVSMLNSVLDYSAYHNDLTDHTEGRAYGLAVATTPPPSFTPILTANSSSELTNYLGDKRFYDLIHARDWCELDRLLRLDFSGNWWGDFECKFDNNFLGQSEILPLHIEFSETQGPYDEANEAKALSRYANGGKKLFSDTFNSEIPYEYTVSDNVVTSEEHDGNKHTYYTLTNITIAINAALFEESYNDKDADRRYNLLPHLTWATFNDEWISYEDEKKNRWENNILRGNFKPGMDYNSGALAFFEAQQDTVTVSGNMGRPRHGARAPDVGQVFANSAAGADARGVSGALARLDNGSADRIKANSKAKPLGRIKTEDGRFLRPFEAGRMVLPVFTETALIPCDLDANSYDRGISMIDLDWIYYLTEFVPLLSGSASLADAWEKAVTQYPEHLGYFSYYVHALAIISDPAFRQAGINWLDSPSAWAEDANGIKHPIRTHRDDCFRSGGGQKIEHMNSLH